MTDFVPRQALDAALRGWWLLVVCGLLGGLAGGVANSIRPPIYQATVSFTTDVDFSLTGPLTEREANQILGSAVNLLFSTRTVGLVIDAAQAKGIAIAAAELRASATLERRVTLLQIHVRHADPQTAAELANLWADIGLAEMTVAAGHATEILAWNARIAELAGCSPYPEPVDDGAESCRFPASSTVKDELQAAREARSEASWDARGISPALLFSLDIHADVPTRPTAYGRPTLIFGGGVVGMIMGAGLLGVWTQRRRDAEPVPSLPRAQRGGHEGARRDS